MADITRKNFVEAAAAMGVMGPMAAMLGTLGASSAQAATIGATDDHIKGPEHPVRTEEEAVEFLFNPEIATEDYTCADGTVIPAVYLNLRNRWNLITGSDIEIVDDGATFSVRMPLQNPSV